MLTVTERPLSQLVFAARPMRDGSQVLVPRVMLPRTCRRLDGVTKVAYESRSEAKGARSKHDCLYRCPHCGWYHLATRRRRAMASH